MRFKETILPYCPLAVRILAARLDGNSLGARLARGTFWGLAGAVISKSLALVGSVWVARMLGVEDFGALGVVLGTVGMFGTFAGLALGLTATKYVAEFRLKDQAKTGRIIALSSAVALVTGLAGSLALYCLAPWLAARTLAAPHLTGLLQIGALVLLLSGINGAQTGALCGFEAFRTIARVNVLAGIASFPIAILGVFFGGLTGAAWASVASLAVTSGLNHQALRSEAGKAGVPLTFANLWWEKAILWRFALPATLAGLVVGPVNWLCSTLLVSQPNGYAEMGILNATTHWFLAIAFLPGILGQTVGPLMAEQFGAGSSEGRARLLALSLKANLITSTPLVILACLLSPLIMTSYGPGFRSGWPTLVMVLLTAGLMAVQAPVGQVIAASGKMWVGFWMNLGWGVSCLVLTSFLAPWGAAGLAFSRLAAYSIHSIWAFAYALHILRQRSKP